MSGGDIHERVVRTVLGCAPRPAEEVSASTDLENDLGYTSVALVELALELEREFELPPLLEGDALEIATVGDVEEIIGRVLSDGPS